MDVVGIKSNNSLLIEEYNCNQLHTSLADLPAAVEIWFQPYKVKPIVRYNNFMLDYWLANIDIYDHKIEFSVSKNFFADYKNKNMQGRIDSLSEQQKSIDHYWDKYIGINNLHPELVAEIKKLIQ